MQQVMNIESEVHGTDFQTKLAELMGPQAKAFAVAVLAEVAKSWHLQQCSPESIKGAMLAAATLKLLPGQGYWYLVPYASKKKVGAEWTKTMEAQFQLGWKGYVQLALRTGQYKHIRAIAVYENQTPKYNALTERLTGKFDLKPEGERVGIYASFKLLSGYEKAVFMYTDDLEQHAKAYSTAYRDGRQTPWAGTGKTGWKEEHEREMMERKTAVRQLLRDWAPLSAEMAFALAADYAVVDEAGNMEHVDAPEPQPAAGDVQGQKDMRTRTALADRLAAADLGGIVKALSSPLHRGKLAAADLLPAAEERFKTLALTQLEADDLNEDILKLFDADEIQELLNTTDLGSAYEDAALRLKTKGQ